MNGMWHKATERLRGSLGQVSYETWIGPLNFIEVQGKTATIEAPNRFFRDWVNDRYLDLLRESLSAEMGETVEVKLTLDKESHVVAPAANGPLRPMAAPPAALPESPRRELHPQLNPRYTFAEFVVGSSNQFAHAAAVGGSESARRKI